MYAYRKEEFLENFIYQVLGLFDNSCNEEEFVPAAKTDSVKTIIH